MIKIGVIGRKESLQKQVDELLKLSDIQISGAFICNDNLSQLTFTDNIKNYASAEELIFHSDAVCIYDIEDSPYELVLNAFRNGKHVFIEQLTKLSIEEIDSLMLSRKEANSICLVGSEELSHPVYATLKDVCTAPLFIETQRQLLYDAANTQDIILDILVKDLAMVLTIVKSDIKRISANGLKVFGDKIEIANVRLEFSNGCIAVMTVNKSAWTNRCKVIAYQEGQIVSADFIEHKIKIATNRALKNETNDIQMIDLTKERANPIGYQLQNFKDCIVSSGEPILKLRKGYQLVETAHKILKKINTSIEE